MRSDNGKNMNKSPKGPSGNDLAGLDYLTLPDRGCDRQQDLVSYLYGEATTETIKQFESHLNDCGVCAREMKEFSGLRQTLQTWQVETAPRIVIEPKRTFTMVLRELLGLMPVWSKGLAAVAAMLVLMALLNVHVSIGKDGFAFSSGWRQAPPTLVSERTPVPVIENSNKLTRDEAIKLVNQLVTESEQRNQAELSAKLAAFSQDLKNSRNVDVARFVKDLRRDQRQQLERIYRDASARNDLDLVKLMNNIN